ncbi:G patch domain-containing protein 11-like [Haliotis rubra]|uniref:G patch domain-containing protein 11-like n=1 Tax=Haliotis rubra TaxID=36100 RepID=UPI001EE567A7|nr:G patch domain-containing protein 11-like [Haliotis rubra]
MSNVDDDEDDYMSDAFLKQCSDTRPGLLPERVAKKFEKDKKKKALNSVHRQMYKPRATLEKEKREEGLKVNIGSDNKGFAMLQKMGYKPGMAIGKAGSGRKEPVPIQLKFGRGGLGQEAHQKRKQEEQRLMRASMFAKRQKRDSKQRTEFVQRMGGRFAEKRADGDLRKSQKVCEQLDAEAGLTKPSEYFFWPAEFHPKNKELKAENDRLNQGLSDMAGGYDSVLDDDEDDKDEEEEEDEEKMELFTAAEMLEILTLYLRKTYKYCVWCGTRYNDAADLASNCPGATAEAHDD